MAGLEQAVFNLISQPWLPIRRKNGSLTYAGLIVWLTRKAEQGGFKLLSSRLLESGFVKARRKGEKVTLSVAAFEGVLTMVDEVRFRETLEQGVGPAKALGMGLLSVAPLDD